MAEEPFFMLLIFLLGTLENIAKCCYETLHYFTALFLLSKLLCPHGNSIPTFFRKHVFLTLEKEMTTHSSILAWEIPWTEEPGGLQSVGSQESDTA